MQEDNVRVVYKALVKSGLIGVSDGRALDLFSFHLFCFFMNLYTVCVDESSVCDAPGTA